MCDEKAIEDRFKRELKGKLNEDDEEVLENTKEFERTSEKISLLF